MEKSKVLRVEVIRRETIKPSSPSPSPDHQGSFKLSLLDQFHAHLYVPTILFYKATCPPGDVNEISQRLKSSLSETLTRFYPFAGRLKDPITISCNDEGVDYSEARVLNGSLVDVLQKPDPKQLHLLIPDEDGSLDLTSRPLLLIQVSFFECGGIALGVNLCHKVADALTFCSFMTGWADSAIGNFIKPATPDFGASTLFPPTNSLPPSSQIIPPNHNKPTSVRTSRFVFGPSELAALQAISTKTNNPHPSRFEAVTAFIWKIAMQSRKESEWKKPSQLTWAVNLRSKLQPPLPDNCFGNLVGVAVHEVGVEGKDMPCLASYLRRGTIDLCNNFIQALKEGESVPGTLELQMHQRNLLIPKDAGTIQLYRVTSWCKLPFYDANFGWGKPLWVTDGGSIPMPNFIVLMNSRDGNGIEATVSLTEEEMSCFESDKELKNYAAFNPSAFS